MQQVFGWGAYLVAVAIALTGIYLLLRDLREVDRTQAGMIVETAPSHRRASEIGASR